MTEDMRPNPNALRPDLGNPVISQLEYRKMFIERLDIALRDFALGVKITLPAALVHAPKPRTRSQPHLPTASNPLHSPNVGYLANLAVLFISRPKSALCLTT